MEKSDTKTALSVYSRKRPFYATMSHLRLLNHPRSSKENLHVTLDLEESGIEYSVGSSFGIFPENCPKKVEAILLALRASPDQIVYDKRNEGSITLRAFLAKKVNLQSVTSAHLNLIDESHSHADIKHILSSKENLLSYTATTDLLTFIEDFWTPSIGFQRLCDVCAPLLPRYYSVASSQKVVGNQVDLMVASFSYKVGNKEEKSVTASFFKDRCVMGQTKIGLFLMDNPHFSLPSDRNTKVILIGPGTGLAALRGFLQEREAQSPTMGGNWLFTGDRNRTTDFYYQEELLEWEKTGFLRLSLAFSRDQEEKHYVQDEMKKHGTDLWEWIEQGAHIYICGDAKRMAKDVTQSLHDIAIEHGRLSEEETKTFFRDLKKTKRFSLDVY